MSAATETSSETARWPAPAYWLMGVAPIVFRQKAGQIDSFCVIGGCSNNLKFSLSQLFLSIPLTKVCVYNCCIDQPQQSITSLRSFQCIWFIFIFLRIECIRKMDDVRSTSEPRHRIASRARLLILMCHRVFTSSTKYWNADTHQCDENWQKPSLGGKIIWDVLWEVLVQMRRGL